MTASQNKPNKKSAKFLMFDVSPEGANLWFDISNIVLLAGAVLVAAGTYGTIKFSGIKEKFSDERISINEAETRKAVAESDKANAALGIAQADIAKANSEIAKANEGVASANARAAEANLKAETERAERVKLELKLAPRSINPIVLASQLAGMAGLRVDIVSYETGSSDVAALAGQIGDGLGRAGFKAYVFTPFADGTVVKGILVRHSTDALDDDKKAAARIVDAFNSVGLAAGSWAPFPANEPPSGAYNGPAGQAADAKVRILIGAKP
ncbi:hypothetical protein [Bradyrhizobium sp. ORS 86]|uniref:hypothetical protein n=1 Tax=Bradyrhizobium sp. ORS 86 TaxID=1685970 RepID=UPI00388EE0C3